MQDDLTFGQWLKRRRRGLGLTQRTLGQRAGYSAETLRKVESDDLRPSVQMAERLAEALELAPAECLAFIRFARDGHTGDDAALPIQTVQVQPISEAAARRHNLPAALTSFVGRDDAIAAIQQLLTAQRLVTLIGPGGIGKSRLSLAVAAGLATDYRHGVRMVQLASLNDPALVPQTVAAVLGFRAEAGQPLLAALAAYLRVRELLLVLDNCEHLRAACADLATALLAGCPTVRLLATSREALSVAGEALYAVPPLAQPAAGALSAGDVLSFEAPQLFAQRAAAALPDFAVSSANAAAVVQVCRRLDGMPLALELAAARVPVLRVEQIAARLDDRFHLLTGGSPAAFPRHQTLRAAIDWSYDLLDESERAVLRRAAAFVGGWSLEAAEAVCAGEGLARHEILDALVSLSARSMLLIERTAGSAARYRLLETIREYGLERLDAAGETAAVRERHLAFYLALAEEADPHTYAPDHAAWLKRVRLEMDNFRFALAWSLVATGDAARGVRLTSALMRYWVLIDVVEEGARWVAQLLGALGPPGASPDAARASLYARAYPRVAYVLLAAGDYRRATDLAEEGLALCRRHGTQTDLGFALLMHAWTIWGAGDPSRAGPLFEESEAVSRAAGQRYFAAVAQFQLASIAAGRYDYARATRLWEQVMVTCRALGDEIGIADIFISLADVAAAQGRYPDALSLCRAGLDIWRQLGMHGSIASALRQLGQHARDNGDFELAQNCFAEAVEIARDLGYQRGLVAALAWQADVARWAGDHARAAALLDECWPQLDALGSKVSIANVMRFRGALARAQGRPDEASEHLCAALRLLRELPAELLARALALRELALLHADQGQPLPAARLLAAATAQRAAAGRLPAPVHQPDEARAQTALRQALGEGAYNQAWAAGMALTRDQALAEALAG